MQDLIDVFGTGQITQAYKAEVAQSDAGRQTVNDRSDHSVRQQYLATVRGGHNARRPIQRAAKVIVVTVLRRPCMQTAAHLQCNSVGCTDIDERLLHRERCIEGVEWLAKRRMHTIADHLHYDTTVTFNRNTRKPVVGCE